MLKDYKILFVLSLFCLLIVALAVVKVLRPEYVAHQKEYAKLTNSPDMAFGIQQVNVETGSGIIVDRCATCHLGMANVDAKDFPKPLGHHPSIVPEGIKDPHNFDEIGCIVCHDGNGRGLTMHDAHGHVKDWPHPLLTGENIQANCTRCHMSTATNLPGAEIYNLGKRFFMEKACWSCHTIDGVSSGKSAPDLTNAGSHFSMAYLKESIVDPAKNSVGSKMPVFNWVKNNEIVNALVVYLKGQQKDKIRDYDKAPVEIAKDTLPIASIDTPSVVMGRRIFTGISMPGKAIRGGCINCHSISHSGRPRVGGVNAPELTYAYRARGRNYLEEHIRNSRKHTMDSNMPLFENLTKNEMESLILFLAYLDTTAVSLVSGQDLYKKYCMSCHGEKLDGRGDLANALDPLPRDFSRYQFVASYKERFKYSIKYGINGTAMPPWKNILSYANIDSLVEYIDNQTAAKRPSYMRQDVALPKVGDKERRDYNETGAVLKTGNREQGEIAFQKFCTSCHGKLANGKGPNAYFLEHPLPRNLLNNAFLSQRAVDDKRLYQSILLGVPGTSMPAHDHLSDQTILDMISYIRSISPDEAKN